MLRRRDGSIVVRIIALYAGDKSYRQASAQKGIFAVSLLPATPTRIAEDVDVWRPEVETLKDVRMTGAFVLRVFDPAFNANDGRHLMNARYVECRRKADGLRKLRGAAVSDAV